MTNSIQNLLTRRSVIQFLGALSANGLLTVNSATAAKKALFGVAILLEPFRNDPRLKEMLIQHADLIVPQNALKWASIRHTKGQFDFSGADEIINFAEVHGRAIHGHALLWYGFNPPWVDAITSPRKLEKLLVEHIETVVGRYRGRIATWDVVNEVVAHDPISQGKWRRGVWYDVLGPKHVDIAFEAAAKADPNAKLFINDYDLEDDSRRTKVRQDAIIDIVRRLQDKNIPVHGVGLQAHLYAERRIGRKNLVNFVRTLDRMGIEVSVTELDIIDWRLSVDHKKRDRGVAATAEEFLEALSEASTPRTVTTWGLSDRYSWIDGVFKRNDNGVARPLPFDESWNPKPLWDVIRRYTG